MPAFLGRRADPGSSANDQAARVSEDKMPRSAAEETRAGGPAPEMLDAFASVGARRFDLTFTDAAGGKAGFRGNRPLDELRLALPEILEAAACVSPLGSSQGSGRPRCVRVDHRSGDPDASPAGVASRHEWTP